MIARRTHVHPAVIAAMMRVAPLLAWAYAHRVQTIALDVPAAFALLFVGQELCYYGYHRAAHRVRWFWATHAVHHSPNELTLAAALRLGWTGKLTGTAAYEESAEGETCETKAALNGAKHEAAGP